MKNLYLIGAGILGLLICSTAAHGADWLQGCQNVAATRAIPRQQGAVYAIHAGGTVCTFPTAADPDPPVLDTTACENFDVLIYADADGDATACAACAYSLEHCPMPANQVAATDDDNQLTEAEAANACVPYTDGGVHATTGETLGAAADAFWLDQTGDVTNDPVIRVRCNPPG